VFSRFSEELKELARELSEYAAGEAAHKEAVNVMAPRQMVETPSIASQPQITETGQGDTYRTISTLTGLPPDDIERQLAKLKEALKELKTSH
jgi:cytochrome c553